MLYRGRFARVYEKDSKQPLYEGKDDERGTGNRRRDGRGKESTGNMERLPACDKGLCPMISAYTGEPACCLGSLCRMWVESEHLNYLMGKKGIEGDCGYKLLSLYAGFELDRMMRYDEIMEDVT